MKERDDLEHFPSGTKGQSLSKVFDDFALDIRQYNVDSLSDNPVALDHALVAVAMVADETGRARRQQATESVVDRLNLHEYVLDRSNKYNNIVGACRQIMNGLVTHDLIARVYPENRDQKKPTVSAYVLTEKGRKRLLALREIDLLPDDVLESGVADDDHIIGLRAEEKKDDIVPLAERLASLQGTKLDCQREVDEIRDRQQTHREAIAGIEAQLGPLRKQIILLQERLGEHEDSIERLEDEAHVWAEEETKGDGEIEKLKRQIEELLK